MNFRIFLSCSLLLSAMVSAPVALAKSKPVAFELVPELNQIFLGQQLSYELLGYNENDRVVQADNRQVIKDVDAFLINGPDIGKPSDYKQKQDYQYNKEHGWAQHTGIKTHLKPIKAVFNNLGLIGDSLGQFIYSKKDVPVQLLTKNGKLALIITGVRSENVYNTLKLDTKERAAKVAESMILPSIGRIYPPIAKTDIRYVGVSVVYGCRDFSQEDEKPKAEMLALIASSDACKKFASGQITDEQFIAGADIYLQDKDLGAALKKVSLHL